MLFLNVFQVVLQSGQPPTVLQQLCSLPFQYFSDPKLTNVLFPTLISLCYNNKDNRQILEQELSCDLLANFIEVSFVFVMYIFNLFPLFLIFCDFSKNCDFYHIQNRTSVCR